MPWKKSTSEASLFSVLQPRTSVSVLSDLTDYKEFLESLIKGEVSQALRSKLALKAFEMTAQYDEAISGYFREQYASAELSEEQLAGPVQRISLRVWRESTPKTCTGVCDRWKITIQR